MDNTRTIRVLGPVLVAAALATDLTGGIAGGLQTARADDLMASHNLLRTGWDRLEPDLSPAVVGGGRFGKLFSTAVNGQVYAQPLVVGGNVLVATENDYVYSLNGQTGAIKWSRSLGLAWPSSVAGCGDVAPYIGVTSTPFYNQTTRTLYVAAVVNDGSNLYSPHVYLFGINAATGTIDWKVPIRGAPVNDRSRSFDPYTERQRASLLMLGGEVYVAFASYCDQGPFAGYVAGVNARTHALTLWTSEAGSTGGQGGIWQSGAGLMSDGTRVFATTGNGTAPAPGPGTRPGGQLGNAVIRLGLRPDGSLAALDFFSPADAARMNIHDQDLGSGGPVGLPFRTARYRDLLIQAGKDGRIFLLNREALGGRGRTTDHPVYRTRTAYTGLFGTPAAFAGTGGNTYIYYVGRKDFMRAFRFNATATPSLTDVANSPAKFGYSSGSPVVTSNGTNPASAVVWEVYASKGTGAGGRLEAFDAIPRAGHLRMIWSAPIGTASKFSIPATSNGRVYVGTRDGHVLGFGSPPLYLSHGARLGSEHDPAPGGFRRTEHARLGPGSRARSGDTA